MAVDARRGATGARTRLAIYDLDRTITRWPTWTPFLLHAIVRRAPWRLVFVPAAIGAALANRLGLLDRAGLKQLFHRWALGTMDTDAAAALADRFAEGFVRRIRSAARDRIAIDRAQGYRIVIATAAYDFYADAIARTVSVDALVATQAIRDRDGRILPLIDGGNCYGAEKLAMIRRWCRTEGVTDAYVRFYTDHVSDVPTLAWSDEPFVVNPRRRLRDIARAQGWTILAWA